MKNMTCCFLSTLEKNPIQFSLLLVFTIHHYHYNDKILSFYKESIVSGETVMMEILYLK